MTFSFSSLPSEIWSLVTCKLDFEDLMCLKTTGCMNLWAKLCQIGSVTTVVVNSVVSKDWRLPPLLNELSSIQTLVIRPVERHDNLKFCMNVTDIPQTTHTLDIQLSNKNWHNTFFNPIQSGIDRSFRIPWLTALVTTADIGLDSLWVSHLPSNLTSLTIARWEPVIDLPIGLEALNLSYISHISTSTCQLPPHLRVLPLKWTQTPSALFSLLPPSLEVLAITRCYESITSEVLSGFPRVMKYLSLNGSIKGDVSKNDWPSGLEELHLANIPFKLWHTLPHTITDLRTVQNGRDGCGTLPIHELPSSLIRLSLGCALASIATTNWASTRIKSLTLACGLSTTLSSLPSSLTFLRLSTADATSRLTLLLESLVSLESLSVQGTIDANFVARLPPRLTSFGTPSISWNAYYDDVASVWKTMEDLKPIKPSTGRNGGKSLFPLSLTHLVIHHIEGESADFLHHLPIGLMQLSIEKTSTLINSDLLHLPPSLIYLNIEDAELVTSQVFKSLPRSLTHIDISSSDNIVDHHIADLPPSLAVLVMINATQLTNQCVRHLPRTLKELHIDNNKLILPESISDFPPSMARKNSSNFVFSNAVFRVEWGVPVLKSN